MDEKNIFWKRIYIVFGLLFFLWGVHFMRHYHVVSLDDYGNMPRKIEGLKGILLSPYLHGDTDKIVSMHLLSNSLPVLVLLTVLLNAFPNRTWIVWFSIQFLSGALVWFLGKEGTSHIGISGIIYGLTGFFLAGGIFRRDRTSVLIAFFVGILYGSSLVGFLPKDGVSWQSHLYGFMIGVVIAFFLRNTDKPILDLEEKDEHIFLQMKEKDIQAIKSTTSS